MSESSTGEKREEEKGKKKKGERVDTNPSVWSAWYPSRGKREGRGGGKKGGGKKKGGERPLFCFWVGRGPGGGWAAGRKGGKGISFFRFRPLYHERKEVGGGGRGEKKKEKKRVCFVWQQAGT